jgi:acetyl esterase/lipase
VEQYVYIPGQSMTLTIQLIGSGSLPAVLLDQDAPFPDDASPIKGISAEFPPTCVLVASEDKLIPVDHSTDAYARLQDLGVDSLLVTCNGMEHGEAECLPGNNWMDSWWEEAIRPSLDFAIERMKA